MPQGALPFQYVEEKGSTGMTALAGLGAYLDLWQVAGLPQSVRRHLGVKGEQGWTDEQMVTSLVLLNLAGGEGVEDLRLLEKDEGLGRVFAAGGDSGDAPAGAPRAAGEVAPGAPPQCAVGLGRVPFSPAVPRPGRGGEKTPPHRVHPRRHRWVARAGKGERRLGGLRPETGPA